MENPDPLTRLFDTASEARVPMAKICERAGIAPTTPSRWKRKRNGATMEKVRKLTEALDAIISESATA